MPTLETPTTVAEDSSQDHNAISGRLVAARLTATPLAEFPGELPVTLDEAYDVQDISIGRWADEIGGWKVGGVPPAFRSHLHASRLAGPIFKSSIAEIASGAAAVMPIFSGGFAAVEAEFVFRLSKSLEPADRDYSDDELRQVVAALHIGAEIASSPMADINKLGPSCVVSDFGNNAGLVIGPAIPGWQELPADLLTASVSVDDVVVGTATAAAVEGGLLEALRFLVRLSGKRGVALPKGTYVSCGALTGIHEITIDSRALVDFGRFGAFHVSFKSMTPGA